MSGEQPFPERVRAWFRRVVRWGLMNPMWVSAAAVLIVGVASFGIVRAFSSKPVAPAAQSAPAAPQPASTGETEGVPTAPERADVADPVANPGPGPGPLAAGDRADAGAPLSPNVKVVFRTYPGRRAVVMWGGTRLGFVDRNKPLVVERPRDSGPMDIVIRSVGYLPVHTRAYTFDDAVVDVRLTPIEKKDTLYGYRQPLAPEDAGAPLAL
jgi:hypothetical protein